MTFCSNGYQGPVVDELNRFGEIWVFGKDVKGREIYIKV